MIPKCQKISFPTVHCYWSLDFCSSTIFFDFSELVPRELLICRLHHFWLSARVHPVSISQRLSSVGTEIVFPRSSGFVREKRIEIWQTHVSVHVAIHGLKKFYKQSYILHLKLKIVCMRVLFQSRDKLRVLAYKVWSSNITQSAIIHWG